MKAVTLQTFSSASLLSLGACGSHCLGGFELGSSPAILIPDANEPYKLRATDEPSDFYAAASKTAHLNSFGLLSSPDLP